jgi:hypothetical protein
MVELHAIGPLTLPIWGGAYFPLLCAYPYCLVGVGSRTLWVRILRRFCWRNRGVPKLRPFRAECCSVSLSVRVVAECQITGAARVQRQEKV